MKKFVAIMMAVLLVMSVTVVLAGSAPAKETQPEKTPVIIMFKDKTDQDLVKQHGGKIKLVYHIKPALAASLPQEAIDALKKHPKIDYVVEDLEIFTMAETLDWGVDRIDADDVHNYNIKGAGVNVAILDTGIDYNHPDLAGNYVWGDDFADDDDDPMDFNGHGTHCAGIVAAVDNEEGVIGVAPEANLYALKVFPDDGPAYYSYTISALEWCIATRTDGDPDNDIQVISMSFGSAYGYGDPGIEPWINEAYEAGILLVGAAGNEYATRGRNELDTVIYPARYDSVIAVAATDINNNRAYFSSTGPDVELSAPGVSIYSTVPGGYGTKSGTSMACPMVSGTAALVMASDSSLTNVEVRQRLQDTADDLGTTGRDTWYGWGLVDADEAAPPTGPSNLPPVADAGADQTVSDTDGDGVEAVTLDGSGSYDPDGSIGSYEWREDGVVLSTEISFTRSFTAGTHTVTLTVTDNGGATDTDTALVTVTEALANTMHVDSIVMSLKIAGINTNAIATVTIFDDADEPVEGATVSGHWSGDLTDDSDVGTTDANGEVALSSDRVKRASGTFIFTVDDVILSGWTYDPTANEETSGSITV